MKNLFGENSKDYLDIIYTNWYRLYMQTCKPKRVCWLGAVPKQIEKKFFLHIDVKLSDVIAKAEALPLIDGCFDLIVVANFHETSKDYRSTFDEISRVLADGGHLLIFSLSPWGSLAVNSLLKNNNKKLLTISDMKNCLYKNSVFLQRRFGLFYRPDIDFMFKSLGFLELFAPFISPWLASVNVTMWKKCSLGVLIDENSCESWG